MVVLFDILLLNGISLLHQPYRVRHQHLCQLLPRPVAGRMQLAERTEVDFGAGEEGAVEALRGWFVKGVVAGWEGVVMKPVEGAYVDLAGGGDVGVRTVGHVGGRLAWIKVKKDYMVGCGDTGDFAIVGARAEGARGWRLGSEFFFFFFLWGAFFLGGGADEMVCVCVCVCSGRKGADGVPCGLLD